MRTTVRGNTTSNAGNSIGMGTQLGANRNFPGTCSGDPDQLCLGLSNVDCQILGVDKGTCVGSAPKSVEWYPHDALVERNLVEGPLALGIEDSGRNSIVRDNWIVGPSAPDGITLNAGIMLRGIAIETSVITGNSVTGVGRALRLDQVFNQTPVAAFFGAQISRNDFVGSDVSIFHFDITRYNLPSEVSDLGRGNYWGRSCDDSDGFRDFDEPDAQGRADSPSLLVTDSHPYGQPVAGLSDAELPATCN
jgi:hypothetical protein